MSTKKAGPYRASLNINKMNVCLTCVPAGQHAKRSRTCDWPCCCICCWLYTFMLFIRSKIQGANLEKFFFLQHPGTKKFCRPHKDVVY